jgi:hypothetical protein
MGTGKRALSYHIRNITFQFPAAGNFESIAFIKYECSINLSRGGIMDILSSLYIGPVPLCRCYRS